MKITDTSSWRARNRAKVNARRRELKALKRVKQLEGKRCIMCNFPLLSKFAGFRWVRIYCNDCTLRYKVGLHRWKRYYHDKLKPKSGFKK